MGTDGNAVIPDAGPPDVLIGDSSVGLPTQPDGATASSGCEDVTVDPSSVVYVDGVAGSDTNLCGSIGAPCKTVQHGIDQAHDSNGTPNVFVANGTYLEAIALKANVNVYGGWVPAASGWGRLSQCSNLTTVIAAPTTTNVTVTVPAGAAKLSTLTIESKGGGYVQPGESIVGILATNTGTTLSLSFVAVNVAKAGDGAAGSGGGQGTTTPECGDAGGDGGSATAVGGKGPGGDAGVFSAAGYAPTTGATGGPGANGVNGTPGGDPACVPCVQCNGGTLSCTTQTLAPGCGTPGQAGCGGGAGGGGGGGGGGGSSVALFVWDADVTLTSTVLEGGGGGNGGPGGPGGHPAAPTSGVSGDPLAHGCPTMCASLLTIGCAGSNDAGAAGGTAGGRGGDGTAGGGGGDGAGGSSFAYVEGGNGTVTFNDMYSKAHVFYRDAGTSADGGNGAPGKSAAQGP